MNHLRAQWTGNPSPDHQHGRAMDQGPYGEHKARVSAGSPAQALRQAQAHEIEGGPRFVQGWRLGESVEEHLVSAGMLEGELEIAFAGLSDRLGTAEGGKEFDAGLDADRAENILTIVVALVESGSGGAGRLGDAAHGEGAFAAPRPKPAGSIEDALFELRISLSGQGPASVPLRRPCDPNYFDYV